MRILILTLLIFDGRALGPAMPLGAALVCGCRRDSKPYHCAIVPLNDQMLLKRSEEGDFRSGRPSIRRVGPVETRGTGGVRRCVRLRVPCEGHGVAG
jgi:hypothetical protein